MAHDISKDFLKNSHFENMTAGFLLRCKNSLWWEISLICHWNNDSWNQKLSFVYVMVPKNYQIIIYIQYRLWSVRIIRALLVRIIFLHVWKCIILGVICRVKFWHLRRKLAVTFSKWLFLKNSLGMSWAIESVKMQVEK